MMKSGQRLVLPASGAFLVFLRRLVGGPGRVWQSGTISASDAWIVRVLRLVRLVKLYKI
jgi:hypothetical protein